MATKKGKTSKRSKKRAAKDLTAKSASRVKGGILTGTGKSVKIQF